MQIIIYYYTIQRGSEECSIRTSTFNILEQNRHLVFLSMKYRNEMDHMAVFAV
jgi:hypothetical protein